MPGVFDDLIPSASAATREVNRLQTPGRFDDLIPEQEPRSPDAPFSTEGGRIVQGVLSKAAEVFNPQPDQAYEEQLRGVAPGALTPDEAEILAQHEGPIRQPTLRERMQMSPMARRLLGPGPAEREALAEMGFSPQPTPYDVASTALKFTSPPPPVSEPIRWASDKFIDLIPNATARGVSRGARDLVLGFPLAAPAGKAVLAAFAGDVLWHLPDQKAAFDRARAAGDDESAAQIATEALGMGALLVVGAGAKARSEFSRARANGVTAADVEGPSRLNINEHGEAVDLPLPQPKEVRLSYPPLIRRPILNEAGEVVDVRTGPTTVSFKTELEWDAFRNWQTRTRQAERAANRAAVEEGLTPAEEPTSAREPTIGQYPEEGPPQGRLTPEEQQAALEQLKGPRPTPAEPSAPPLPELHPTSESLIDAIVNVGRQARPQLGDLYGALEATPIAKRILENQIARIEQAGGQPADTKPLYDRLSAIEKFENDYLETVTRPPVQRTRASTGDVVSTERPAPTISAPEAAGETGTAPAPAAESPGLISGSAAEAWADRTIAEGKQRLHTGLDPELLAAYVVKGAAIMERGARRFAEWAPRMIAEHGDAIRPYLRHIYEQASASLAMREAERSSQLTTLPTAVHWSKTGGTSGHSSYERLTPEKRQILGNLVRNSPIMRPKPGESAHSVAERFIDAVADNLVWLYHQMPEDLRQRAKLWYVGGHAMVRQLATEYGHARSAVAGVIAVLSPQTEWNRNVSLARRVLDIWHKQQRTRPTSEMRQAAIRIASEKKNPKPWRVRFDDFFQRNSHLRLEQMSLKDKATFVRLYDEGHNPRTFEILSPEGEYGELARMKKKKGQAIGDLGKVGWKSFPEIAKALAILENPTREVLNQKLGNQHKVRNFYNNLIDPTDPNAITIDTHAVAAGHLQPFGGGAKEVLRNFGGAGAPQDATTGLSGTYPLYHEAYRRAAERLGVLPRELQSITWEAGRAMFTPEFKRNNKAVAKVRQIWQSYRNGNITADEARFAIGNFAGGIRRPAWAGRTRGNRPLAPEGTAPYEAELPGRSGVRTADRRGNGNEPAAAISPEGKSVGEAPRDKFEAALDRLKHEFQPGELHAFGLIPKTWNALIETVRLAYRGGKSIHEAIEHGLAWLRATHGDQKFDEWAVRRQLRRTIEGEGAKSQAAAVQFPSPEGQQLGIAAPGPFVRSAFAGIARGAAGLADTVKTIAGRSMPRTTRADRTAGELGVRYASSRIAAPYAARSFVNDVLRGLDVDPVNFGAALTEDNLRSVKAGFLAQGNTTAAAAVKTLIGSRNSPFRTEQAYQDFLNRPATQAALARHKQAWATVVEPQYKAAMRLDDSLTLPTRGRQTEARINLYGIREADRLSRPRNIIAAQSPNLTATFRRKSPFGRRATGASEEYAVDYHDIMANTFGRQLEIANKNKFDGALVQSGNAVIGPPGERPTLHGEETVSFPLQRTVLVERTAGEGEPQTKSIPVSANIYVRKSLAREYELAANLYRNRFSETSRVLTGGFNRAALAGLTDATVHLSNLGTVLFTRPMTGLRSPIGDMLTAALGRADIPINIIRAIRVAMRDNSKQLSELAEIGVLRPEHPTWNPAGKAIQWADKTTRLLLDDTFKAMADRGLVENTETGRREFSNQAGQYNKRLQGVLTHALRESGIGPFITAGKAFNTLAVRNLLMDPGAKTTSPQAWVTLRAGVAARWVGAIALIGAINYLLTKDKGGGVAGRPGTPLGRIDTGRDNEAGRPLTVPALDMFGLGRPLRVTGVRGFIESKRLGLDNQAGIDAAARDVVNSWSGPIFGPAVRFGVGAFTGYSPAMGVGRLHPVVPPGDSQFASDLANAVYETNPLLATARESGALANAVPWMPYADQLPAKPTSDVIARQIPRFTLLPGKPAEMVERFPEVVQRAKSNAYLDDVIHRSRVMGLEQRTQFLQDSIAKLPPEEQQHAWQEVKRRRVLMMPAAAQGKE